MAPHPSDPETARPASQPTHEVRTLRDVRIPVSDGLELSANRWLPQPAADGPDEQFPAILEMISYRKDDWRAASDHARGEWLAARGFALCRLDVRGTGSSPGIALDEYTARETQDGSRSSGSPASRGEAERGSRLVLPVLPAGASRREVPPFKTTPAGLADLGTYEDEPPVWQIVEDVLDGSVTVRTSEFGAVTLPDGRTSLYSGERLEMTARVTTTRPTRGWTTRSSTGCEMATPRSSSRHQAA